MGVHITLNSTCTLDDLIETFVNKINTNFEILLLFSLFFSSLSFALYRRRAITALLVGTAASVALMLISQGKPSLIPGKSERNYGAA